MDSMGNVNSTVSASPLLSQGKGELPLPEADRCSISSMREGAQEGVKAIPLEQVMGILQSSPEILWRFEPYANFVSCSGLSGRVFSASFDRLYCLEKETGTKEWEIPIDGRIKGDPVFSSRGAAFFGIDAGIGQGELKAIDEESGREIWSTGRFNGEIHSCALDERGGTLFVSTFSGELYAFDAGSGKRRWAEKGYSSAVVDDEGRTFILDDKRSLVAIDSDGRKSILRQGDETIFRGPLIGPDGTLIVAGYDKPRGENSVVRAFDKKTGEPRWSFVMDGEIGVPEIDAGPDGVIYASGMDRFVTGSRHQMVGLNGRTGERLWDKQWKSGDFVASPSFKTGKGATVFIYDEENDLRVLDGKTGDTITNLKIGKQIPLDEAGSIVYGDDGALFLRADDSVLVYGSEDLLRRLQFTIEKKADCHYPPLITKDGTALFIDNHHACAARHPHLSKENGGAPEKSISIEETEEFVDFGGIRLSRNR